MPSIIHYDSFKRVIIFLHEEGPSSGLMAADSWYVVVKIGVTGNFLKVQEQWSLLHRWTLPSMNYFSVARDAVW